MDRRQHHTESSLHTDHHKIACVINLNEYNNHVFHCLYCMTVQCSVFTKYMYMVVELVQGTGKPANYYSEIKDGEYEQVKDAGGYEKVKEVDEYEVMDGGETFINPGVQREENDTDKFMEVSGNDILPPPVLTTQEPPNQTIQQTPSDGECEVRTSDVDESRTYTNVDPHPSMNVQLTKNPAYGLPPVGMLPPDHVNHEGTQL